MSIKMYGFIIVLLIAFLTVIIYYMVNYFDPSFASEISLKYYYNDKEIDVKVTDRDDIKIIKNNLKGLSFKDNPSCGFSADISIKFSDGKTDVILCPARDNCSKAKIENTSRYVKIKDRIALEKVLEKYGVTFPCV